MSLYVLSLQVYVVTVSKSFLDQYILWALFSPWRAATPQKSTQELLVEKWQELQSFNPASKLPRPKCNMTKNKKRIWTMEAPTWTRLGSYLSRHTSDWEGNVLCDVKWQGVSEGSFESCRLQSEASMDWTFSGMFEMANLEAWGPLQLLFLRKPPSLLSIVGWQGDQCHQGVLFVLCP